VNDKVTLDFETISRALKQISLPPVDCVVGIAEGGIVPASLLAHQLGLPMHLLRINYRAPDNSPRHSSPTLLADIPTLPEGARILLVDDVSVSGQTLALARDLLQGHEVITFTLKGRADFVLFPEIAACVNWPWK
jgi:adenine/guanine phosphoribosyltransferase-like PRPP-binding protein